MSFELSILRKYLIPRKRHLSSALIACISLGVISVVVWLVLVFLSVTEGIEKTWLQKLTSLQAPIRVTPTKKYLNSRDYLVDLISHKAGYAVRSLAEKVRVSGMELYDAEVDEGLPTHWVAHEGKDPAVLAASILEGIRGSYRGVEYAPFEMSGAILKVETGLGTTVTQASYLASFPEEISYMESLLLPGLLPLNENGIVIPKNLQGSGVKIGARGWIQYQTTCAGALQEVRCPIIIAGFYDPGVIAVGNKCLLAPTSLVHLIRTASPVEHIDPTAALGFSLWHTDLSKTKRLASDLTKALHMAGIDTYWKVSTYHDYDFSKDLVQQFHSDRLLFTFLGLIILIVACSNIVSFLILLVQDKKKEIGILQAVGASKKSIALIFGGCGVVIGLVSSFIGTVAAFFTLRHLDAIVNFLSFLQGHPAFNPHFYGSSLPSQMSLSALFFVAIVTPLLALIAGLIPAWKACKLSPSATLRSE